MAPSQQRLRVGRGRAAWAAACLTAAFAGIAHADPSAECLMQLWQDQSRPGATRDLEVVLPMLDGDCGTRLADPDLLPVAVAIRDTASARDGMGGAAAAYPWSDLSFVLASGDCAQLDAWLLEASTLYAISAVGSDPETLGNAAFQVISWRRATGCGQSPAPVEQGSLAMPAVDGSVLGADRAACLVAMLGHRRFGSDMTPDALVSSVPECAAMPRDERWSTLAATLAELDAAIPGNESVVSRFELSTAQQIVAAASCDALLAAFQKGGVAYYGTPSGSTEERIAILSRDAAGLAHDLACVGGPVSLEEPARVASRPAPPEPGSSAADLALGLGLPEPSEWMEGLGGAGPFTVLKVVVAAALARRLWRRTRSRPRLAAFAVLAFVVAQLGLPASAWDFAGGLLDGLDWTTARLVAGLMGVALFAVVAGFVATALAAGSAAAAPDSGALAMHGQLQADASTRNTYYSTDELIARRSTLPSMVERIEALDDEWQRALKVFVGKDPERTVLHEGFRYTGWMRLERLVPQGVYEGKECHQLRAVEVDISYPHEQHGWMTIEVTYSVDHAQVARFVIPSRFAASGTTGRFARRELARIERFLATSKARVGYAEVFENLGRALFQLVLLPVHLVVGVVGLLIVAPVRRLLSFGRVRTRSVPSKPPAGLPPERVGLPVGYWNTLLPEQAEHAQKLREVVIAALKEREGFGIKLSEREIIQWGGYQFKESRKQLVVEFRRAKAYVTVQEYGHDLYVRWDSHVNMTTWQLRKFSHAKAVGTLFEPGIFAWAMPLYSDVPEVFDYAPEATLPTDHDWADVDAVQDLVHEVLTDEVKRMKDAFRIGKDIDYDMRIGMRMDVQGGATGGAAGQAAPGAGRGGAGGPSRFATAFQRRR